MNTFIFHGWRIRVSALLSYCESFLLSFFQTKQKRMRWRHCEQHAAVLLAIAAIGQGEWSLAESAVLAVAACGVANAICMNLLGVCAEVRGDVRRAKQCYGSAIRADHRFEPAQQNMRRLFELSHFGASREPLAIGDALTDLQLAMGGIKRFQFMAKAFS